MPEDKNINDKIFTDPAADFRSIAGGLFNDLWGGEGKPLVGKGSGREDTSKDNGPDGEASKDDQAKGEAGTNKAGSGAGESGKGKDETPAGEQAADKKEEEAGTAVAKSAVEPEDTLDSVMEELNSLVGLENIKSDVKSLMNFINVCQLREKEGLKVPKVSYHLVFTGNPGTGKTTIARLVAKLYTLMGILPQGQLVETDRSGLVAGYLGQTAIKTQEVIQKAMGGVLFIDEAYSLANDDQDSYGKEAIETILKAMEDNRDKLVVIVAGYDDLMHKFIDSNPGLSSRFNKYFHFEDYSGEELTKILVRFCSGNGYVLAEGLEESMVERLNQVLESKDEHFGNARYVRNLFELAIHCQADRLAGQENISAQELQLLTEEDINNAIDGMRKS